MRQCKSCRNWIHYDDECCPVCQAIRERDEARGIARNALHDDIRKRPDFYRKTYPWLLDSPKDMLR